MGIAIVTPSEKLLSLLEREDLRVERLAVEENENDKYPPTEDAAAPTDSGR